MTETQLALSQIAHEKQLAPEVPKKVVYKGIDGHIYSVPEGHPVRVAPSVVCID